MNSEQTEQIYKIKAARRETVICSYNAAKAENAQRFLEGDKKATSEYIYYNQQEDAACMVNQYYNNNCYLSIFLLLSRRTILIILILNRKAII